MNCRKRSKPFLSFINKLENRLFVFTIILTVLHAIPDLVLMNSMYHYPLKVSLKDFPDVDGHEMLLNHCYWLWFDDVIIHFQVLR